MLKRVDLLGIGVDSVTMEEALAEMERLIAAGTPSLVVTPNVDLLVRLQTDAEFKRAYDHASLVVADGMPLLWVARFLGTPLKAKVSGSDLFVEFCALAARKGHSVFLMGAGPGVAEKAGDILKARFPGLVVAGAYSPSYGFEKNETECADIVRQIRAARPDVVFVGISSPKQDKWIMKYKDIYGAPVSIGVGAAFDFVAGTVKRAPVWMQNAGLEWLWRLLMEPKRLWRRYLVDDPKFFWYALKQKQSRKRP